MTRSSDDANAEPTRTLVACRRRPTTTFRRIGPVLVAGALVAGCGGGGTSGVNGSAPPLESVSFGASGARSSTVPLSSRELVATPATEVVAEPAPAPSAAQPASTAVVSGGSKIIIAADSTESDSSTAWIWLVVAVLVAGIVAAVVGMVRARRRRHRNGSWEARAMSVLDETEALAIQVAVTDASAVDVIAAADAARLETLATVLADLEQREPGQGGVALRPVAHGVLALHSVLTRIVLDPGGTDQDSRSAVRSTAASLQSAAAISVAHLRGVSQS